MLSGSFDHNTQPDAHDVARQVALGRLQDFEVKRVQAERLLDLEPDFRDAWLAYVALAPASVIDDLLEHVTGD